MNFTNLKNPGDTSGKTPSATPKVDSIQEPRYLDFVLLYLILSK